MKRMDVLKLAGKAISGDRENNYGTPESNFAKIAEFWNAYLDLDKAITAEDVANMMILMKVARNVGGNYKADNYVDIAGYAACGAEIGEIGSEETIRVDITDPTMG